MLLLFGALMFGLAVMFLRGSRYEDEDEWEDEDEFDERGDTTSADTLLDDYVED